MDILDQDDTPPKPRDSAPVPTLDLELLFRLEMTARQVKGLFAHSSQPVDEDQGSESAGGDLGRGLASEGQLLKDSVWLIGSLFEEVARAATSSGPAAQACPLEREGMLRTRMLAYPAGRAIFMPVRLKDSEEKFFTLVLGCIAQHQISVTDDVSVAHWLLQNPDQLQLLFELAQRSESAGMTPAMVALEFLDPFLR